MRKYIRSMIPLVEKNVKESLPEKFAIMFDGWFDSKVQYVSVFATHLSNGTYSESFLAHASLLKKDDVGTNQLVAFISETLAVFEKDLKNIIELINDNWAVNQKISKLAKKTFIGYTSHKVNLSVEKWIDEQTGLHEALIFVRIIVSQLRKFKNASRLRELARLGVVLPNEMRWKVKFELLRQYFFIESFVKLIGELESHLLTPFLCRIFESSMTHFSNFESVSVNL